MITIYPFGNSGGFGDGSRANEYYFSRSIQRGLFGFMTGYNVAKVKDSVDISGLGSVKRFADASGYVYCVDSNGKIYKEATPGAADFGSAAVRNPGAGYGGQGLLGDQQGRLLYFGATVIGMLAADGTTWTDSWKTGLTDYDHPADTYEGMTLFGNKTAVGLLSSSDTLNLTAFTLPSSMNIDALKSGKNGVLIGANLGYRGVLILWDAQASRSIAPWIWTNGKVQAIERVDTGWIVVTQKEVLLTNGYTTQKLVQLLDDPLGYSQFTVTANGVLAINNKIIILNQANGYGRQKSGVSIFDLSTGLFEFVPVSTGNVRTAQPLCIYASKSSTQEIFLGYTDTFLSKNYIGSLNVTGGTMATYVSEILAASPTEKFAEAIILNVGVATPGTSTPQPLTFTASVKIYNFDRPLWGVNATNAVSATAITLRVDGTSTSLVRGVAGDEVTILEGLNAGQVRHIASIANPGASNETWTLDSALPNATETNVQMSVQPFKLVEKKEFTTESTFPELFFDVDGGVLGKKFLVKIVYENLGFQLETHPCHLVVDDLSYVT